VVYRAVALPPPEAQVSIVTNFGILRRGMMSALGHQQTYALQKGMSALARIATTKATSLKNPCLLWPQKRTCAAHSSMSA